MCPNQPQRHQALPNLRALPGILAQLWHFRQLSLLVAQTRELGARTGTMASLALQLCAFAALTALASAIPISELPLHFRSLFCIP